MNVKSIGFRLVVGGCFAVLIPLAVVGYIATSKSSVALEQLAKVSIGAAANDMAALITKILDEEKRLAQAFASGDLVRSVGEKILETSIGGATSEIKNLRKKMKEKYKMLGPQYLGVFVTNKDGLIYTGELEGGREYKGANLAGLDFFKQAKLSGGPVVGEISKSKVTGDIIAVICAPVYSHQGQFVGIFGISMKATNFTDIVLAKKVGKTGYAFMANKEGIVIAHPVKKHELTLDMRRISGMEEISGEMLAGARGVLEYVFQGTAKIAGYAPIAMTGWSVAITQNKMDFLEAPHAIRKNIILVTVVSVALVFTLIILVSRTITKPINLAVASLKDIAEGEGDLTMRLPVTSEDEIGELAKWFNIFIEKLQKLIGEIGENTISVDSAAARLTDISNNLSTTAEETSTRSASVASAAEEMSSNMNSVAAGMEQSTTNTSMVASAAEEMTATINEIAANSKKAHKITEQAVQQAENTSNKMNELSDAAQAISKVTETITEISEQTNLLALNATIEAARAGDAGKGFAVVANEIKELAKQTADATLDIKQQIDGVQGTTASTIDEIKQISSIINSVNEIVSTITVAVGEQSAATNEIATNISQASQGMGEVNENINQITSVASTITEDVGNVNMAAKDISDSSSQVKSSAEDLGELAARLRVVVNNFKV
ncbi:MAG: chemotaxis protein [Desulfotalea sp.]|nr:MAG: chemotaxis protein [Desulfotalea sp.]